MRPKLRDDFVYVDVDGGAYVEWPLGSLTLPEPPSYVLLDSVVAYLDGSHTLDALAGALTEPQRTAVLDLIALLHQRGLVREVAQHVLGLLRLRVRRARALRRRARRDRAQRRQEQEVPDAAPPHGR